MVLPRYTKNYYEILGVEPEASLDEIKKVYRELVKEYHPDAGKKHNPDIFVEISEPYDVLSDPVKKMDYEREFFGGKKKPVKHPEAGRPARAPSIPEPQSDSFTVRMPQPPAPDEDEQTLRGKARRNPDSVEAKYSLAVHLLDSNKNPVEAERLLQDIYRSNPYLADVAFRLGVAKCHQGETAEAEKMFLICSQTDPGHGDSASCLACIALKRDKKLNVGERLSRAPASAKAGHRYHVLLGEYHLNRRQQSIAKAHLEKAVELSPRSVKALMLLASCLCSAGKRADAMAVFKKALTVDPANLSLLLNIAMNTTSTGDIKIGNVTIPNPESVEQSARTMKIHYNKNVATVIEMKKKDILIADVQVIEGAPVNVLFMDEAEFGHYSRRQPYRFFRDGTRLDTCRVLFSIAAPHNGKFYLVVENSGFTAGGAEPDILNSSGMVIARIQTLVGIPGTARKPLTESPIFSMFPVDVTSEFEERLIYGEAGTRRKRNITYHVL